MLKKLWIWVGVLCCSVVCLAVACFFNQRTIRAQQEMLAACKAEALKIRPREFSLPAKAISADGAVRLNSVIEKELRVYVWVDRGDAVSFINSFFSKGDEDVKEKFESLLPSIDEVSLVLVTTAGKPARELGQSSRAETSVVSGLNIGSLAATGTLTSATATSAIAPKPFTFPSHDAALLMASVALPPHDEIMRELRQAAREKEVYWEVWCTAFYKGDKEQFSAIATKGKPLNIYVEEGATDHWSVSDYATPDGAAFALLQILKGPPNASPHHGLERVVCPFRPWKGTPKTTPQAALHRH